MRIVACVKHVPDVQGERRFTADGRVEREPGGCALDEADEHTVEAALALAGPGDEVVVLTMGPEHARDALRRALGMGAGSAVLVTDPALAGSDVFATAAVLAAAIRTLAGEGGVDLVLLGAGSSDAGTGVLPVLLGAELDVPCAGPATELDVRDGVVRVRCAVDGGDEVREGPLPAVVAVAPALNEPRYATAAGLRAARGASLRTWTVAGLGLDPAAVGAAGARVRVARAEPRAEHAVRVLVTDDGTAATRLAAYLLENGLA